MSAPPELTPDQRIIRRFGGPMRMAEILKRPQRTMYYWANCGIPRRHMQEVLEAGRMLDPPLTPEEFFDIKPPAKRRGRPPKSDAMRRSV